MYLMPYKENSRFFPTRETGNLRINMAEADLSPTTFTSSSTSDSDYDISLRNPKRNAKPKVCRSSTMSRPINWIKLPFRRTDQTTENNSQEMAACLFLRKRRSKGHEQELREELLYSHHKSELKTAHHEKLLRLIYLTVIHLLFPT